FLIEHVLDVPRYVGLEQAMRNRLHQPRRADMETGNVAGQRALAQDAAPVEQMDIAEQRRAAGLLLGQLQARAEIGVWRRVEIGRGLLGRARVAQELHVGREGGDLRSARNVDVEAGAEEYGVEALGRLGRLHRDACIVDDHVEPWFGETEREARQYL